MLCSHGCPVGHAFPPRKDRNCGRTNRPSQRQPIIMRDRIAHNYEGSNWVAYDHQFRREMLARKDLNWSFPNARLYNEAFTGRAKSIPRCPHCLGDNHTGATCPFNPSPIVVGWLQDNHPFLPSSTTVTPFLQGQPAQERAEQRHAAISTTIAADFRVVATSTLVASAVAHIRW